MLFIHLVDLLLFNNFLVSEHEARHRGGVQQEHGRQVLPGRQAQLPVFAREAGLREEASPRVRCGEVPVTPHHHGPRVKMAQTEPKVFVWGCED